MKDFLETMRLGFLSVASESKKSRTPILAFGNAGFQPAKVIGDACGSCGGAAQAACLWALEETQPLNQLGHPAPSEQGLARSLMRLFFNRVRLFLFFLGTLNRLETLSDR